VDQEQCRENRQSSDDAADDEQAGERVSLDRLRRNR